MMWYYKDEDIEIGPLKNSELKELVKTKVINGRTLVRNDEDTTWLPLAQRVAAKVQEQKKANAPSATPPPISPKDQELSLEEPLTQAPQKPSTPSLTSAQPQELTLEEPEIPNTPPPTSTQPQELTLEEPVDQTLEKIVKPQGPKERKLYNFPFSFTGNGSEYFKIWIVNILLSIVTLGIYSAWAKVRKKQYFYGNTKVNGTSFNYLANPITILKGRVIVFIGFVIYSIMESFNPYIALAMALAMLPLLPLFIVRALKFNARNSATRNIRFNFHATYIDAAKVFLFWPLLIPFTLGIIFPYVYFKQKKFIVENSSFGTTPFSFTAEPGNYYKIYLKLILPAIGVGIIGAIANSFFTYSSALISLVFYLYVIAYISVKNTNLLYNSTRLGNHSFTSNMITKEYLIIFVTNSLATVFTAGFFFPVAEIRMHKYQLERLSLNAVGSLDQFVADEKHQVSALGDEAVDFFDLDIGI